MTKIALVTGITGQDGSYLAEFLLEKGYVVHGIRRRASSFNTQRLDHLIEDSSIFEKQLFLHYGDMTDSSSLTRIVEQAQPDEVYNLAAQSHVHVSFDEPEYTADSDAVGTLRLLESIRMLKLSDNTRFYQASTSELYGLIQETPQSENTPFYPRSPYAVAKLYAYWITVNYREAYGMYACNGILFNHESPRRGEIFVTRKIVIGLVNISLGHQKVLRLGNLNALRDWGHARDYVDFMWRMLQQDKPKDYVAATGIQCSVRSFIETVSGFLNIEITWQGKGEREIGIDQSGNTIIKVDKKYFRPSEVDNLLGDASLAKKELGWEPKVNLKSLAKEMVEVELKRYGTSHHER